VVEHHLDVVVVGGSIPLVPTKLYRITMFSITFPDGRVSNFDNPIVIVDLAASISKSLSKIAIAAAVDDKLVDLSYVVSSDVNLRIITNKDAEALEVIRHSTAHLLAQAVKQLFPSANVTIGPVIEDGFYYDFAYDKPFTPEDLSLIEKRMHELVRANHPIIRRELKTQDAINYFLELGEKYKAEIIKDIPTTEALSLYKQGDFEDLCRGPHVSSTGKLGVFKLTKISGAYWRGDAKNAMLQRIYGTAWSSEQELKDYLYRIEEAEKRDHRKLGKHLDLFHFQDIAPGMVFWHHKGWTIYNILRQYLRDLLQKYHYEEINTPQIIDKILWEKSGHLDNYSNNMFFTETENRQYAIKPMNCPAHVQIYNQGLKSYRDLPLRYLEFGNCHRCEPSGSLHGLMRVRNFVQDDAHIFCTEEQIQDEVKVLLELVKNIYNDFGFDKITYRLALRPENRVGSDESWDKAEFALRSAMDVVNITWIDAKGEGAFYGPKIECSLTDSLGRIWQCGTIQIDFSMPERLEAVYVAEDSTKKHPVMIHRALLGSLERFMGILIEHYAGKFPLWLAPVQIVILNISAKHEAYAQEVSAKLADLGIRSICDTRNEKVGFKIREHTLQNVPYLVIIGDEELAAKMLRLRLRNGDDLGMMTIESLYDKMRVEILNKDKGV
jgi:threonyl-tRNA synthetase